MKNLLVSILGGAVAGWVTNSIAVGMLFKKFFGRWGGVIESGYRELIQNLSRLVEQKLINARTLESEIQKPAFNDTLRRWVKEILEKELPEKTKNLRVKDIPGIDETIDRLTAYFERERIAPVALSGITVSRILSEESYRRIAEKNSSKILSSAAEHKSMIAQTLNAFFSLRAFDDILSKNVITQIKANINETVEKINFSDAGIENWIDNYFETFFSIIGIDDIIKKIEDAARQVRIGDLARCPQVTARLILSHLADFLESGPGRDLLSGAVHALIGAAETFDTKVRDILHPDLTENLNVFIKRAAPELIDRLILFVIDQRYEIDNLINEAAALHFNSGGRESNPMRAFVFRTVSRSTGFADRIIETLSNSRRGAGEKLAAEFTAFIKKTSVGQIVSALKEAGLLNADDISAAVPGWLRTLQPENSKLFTSIIDAKLKNIFPDKFIDFSFVKTNLLPRISGALREFLKNESKNNRLCERINNAIDSYAAGNIGDTIDFTKISFDINETDVKNFIIHRWQDVAGISAGKLLPVTTGIFPWNRMAESVKNAGINGVYNILRNEALYNRAADAVQSLIARNLDTVLGGSIFEIAKNELNVLSPPEVNSMVHDFMGKQLKPINIIGAVLGGLAGAVTAAASFFFGLPSGFPMMFAVYGLVFALAGIGTNWIAIKMLFRPYKRIAGLNFPPFIGVTALKQPEFAAGIAKLIQQNMLNESALRRFYAEKKEAIYAQCRERLSSENYSFIDDFFSDDRRLAAAVDGVLDALSDWIKSSHTKLAEDIDRYITDRIESGRTGGFTANLAEALFKKLKSGGAAYAGKEIGKKIQEHIADKNSPEYHSSKIIDALLPLFCQCLRQNLQNIINVKIPRRYAAAFKSYIENHTVSDLAGISDSSGFFNRLAEKMEKIGCLPQRAAAAVAGFAGKLKTDGRQSLKSCFGGAIPALIKNKGSLLNGMICRLAASRKPEIVSMIMDGSGGGSFFHQLVKQAANALLRGDVEAITDIVIDEKLFPFLEARRDAVFGILNGVLESPFGFDCKVFNEKNTIFSPPVLSRLFASEGILQPIKNLSQAYLNNILGVKLKNLLSPVNMDTPDRFMERASPIVNIVVSEIAARLDDSAAVSRLKKLFNHISSEIFGAGIEYSLLRGTDMEAETVRILAVFFNDPAVDKTANVIMENLLQKTLSDKDFYEHALFRRDVSFFLKNCVNENSPYLPRNILAGPLRGLFGNTGRLISAETKDAVCGDYMLPAMFNACENQFPNLVDSLSLYSVVEREINVMPPQEIEGVFYSFAGPYFKKIILYGWIGLFAGLLSYAVSCLLALPP
ncbi:MAG: DUF445 family protein [Spirochaetaceae bacterium]|nr:DUF445 family protein [Spirochaetaceae bacterium]